MPYSYPGSIPRVALNWTAKEQQRCTEAAQAALDAGKSEEEAIFACIAAAGKSKKEDKTMAEEIIIENSDSAKAEWTSAYIGSLPDSCFLHVESGGEKDEEGKTKPRSLRHLPYRNKEGAVDLPHLRNALSRLGQPATGKGWLTAALRKKLITKAEGLLKKHGKKETKTMDEEIIVDNVQDEMPAAEAVGEVKAIPDAPEDGAVGEHISEEIAAKGAPSGDPNIVKAQTETVIPKDNCGVPTGLAVKALGQHRIGGYAALWGGPDRKDLVEEYFTPETGEMLNVFDAVGALPLFYHHGMDETVKATVVGLVDIMQLDDVGLWYEAEMKKGNEYREAIAAMIAERSLHTSTGCLPGHRKVAPDGWLEQWCIVDISNTQTPMEYRMLERPVEELQAVYKAAGLKFPEIDDGEGADEVARQRKVAVERERLALLELWRD